MTDGQSSPTANHEVTGAASEPPATPRLRFGAAAVIAIVILAGLGIWLVVESVSNDSGSTTSTTAVPQKPVAVSAEGLSTIAAATGGPIYWAGPGQVSLYEVTISPGRSYVRYLPDGANAGDPRTLTTIGTYRMQNAYGVTRRTSTSSDVLPVTGGGIAVVDSSKPTSVYVAFKGVDYQIEVFDPDAAAAKRIATGGTVRPVPPPVAAREPEIVSESDLVDLSKELGHPVYWAGPDESKEYELTVDKGGNVWVRYLPKGAKAGTSTAGLVVGTYPMADAYVVTKRIGNGPGTTTVKLENGGVAVYGRTNRTNVHFAYRGQDLQLEVFNPAGGAPAMVVQGKTVPVG